MSALLTEVEVNTSNPSSTLFGSTASISSNNGTRNFVRLYPGDLVAYRVKRPFDSAPCFGIVLAPNNPFIRYVEEGMEPTIEGKTDYPTATTTIEREQGPIFPAPWNYEDGLTGTFLVQWSHSNRIATVSEDDITVVDRPVTIGQRIKNELGLSGVVTSTTRCVTLQMLNTNHVIEGVSSDELNPVSQFVRGREIFFEGWIGVITAVKRQLDCRLDRGGIFTFTTNEADGFMSPDLYWAPGMVCPGARNKFPTPILKRANFESRTMKFFHRFIPPVSYLYASSTSTTIGVEALALDVYWLQRCPMLSKTETVQPPTTLDRRYFKKIKPLGVPSYDTIGMNSVRMYKYKSTDPVITYSNWLNGFQTRYFGSDPKAQNNELQHPKSENSLLDQTLERPVKVILQQTFANVLWEDGTKDRILASRIPYLLSPNIDPMSGPPSGLIVEPVFSDGTNKYGVIQDDFTLGSDQGNSKIASVRWILPGEKKTTNLGLKNESIYNIIPHNKFAMYQKGTSVFINEPTRLYEAGTVYNLDVSKGKVLVTVPEERKPVLLWPHELTPMSKRCSWNFFTRSWTVDDLLPPLHQNMLEETCGFPQSDANPISLGSMNNNSEIKSPTIWDLPTFDVVSYAPEQHKYHAFPPKNPSAEYTSFLIKEISQLKENLPEGVWVFGYENRMDLFSIAILGPKNTCYADGLFLFDVQIPTDFPLRPPKVHYVPYSFNQISPFIAHDGTFCTSKLEMNFDEKDKPISYIGDCLRQIQELIFTPEPYLRFLGKDVDSEVENQEFREQSRSYNEGVFLDVLLACYNMAMKPYDPFQRLIQTHLASMLPSKLNSIKSWVQDSNDPIHPDFNLRPFSDGFSIAIQSRIQQLEILLGIDQTDSLTQNVEKSQECLNANDGSDIEAIDPITLKPFSTASTEEDTENNI